MGSGSTAGGSGSASLGSGGPEDVCVGRSVSAGAVLVKQASSEW